MSDSSTSSLDATRAQWQAKWRALAPRERQLITVMVWAVGLTLVYMIGVRPAWRSLSETPAQLREVQGQLDNMQLQAEESRRLRQLPVVPPPQAEAALRSAIARLGPAASLNVQVDRATATFTQISGPKLVEWLQEARSSARARPIEASLIQVSPGVYSGTVTVVLAAMPPAPR